MSLFKSIKKMFKKFKKVVKKIAPYLLIAAAVYFGGSYMMSLAGGATAAQAGSVAGSFTKSAGVWQSFLGGLVNLVLPYPRKPLQVQLLFRLYLVV